MTIAGAFVAARLLGLSPRASVSTAIAFAVGAFVGAVSVVFISAAIVGFAAELEPGTVFLGSIACGRCYWRGGGGVFCAPMGR